MVGSVPLAQAIAVTALSSVVAAALLVAAGMSIVATVLTVIAALVAALVLRRSALRRFDVISGDVLGAGVEIATTAALFAAALSA